MVLPNTPSNGGRTSAAEPSSFDASGRAAGEINSVVQGVDILDVSNPLYATLALVFGLAVGIELVRLAGDSLDDRFGTTTAEFVQTVLTSGLISVAVVGIASVWNMTYLVEFAVDAVVVDRWTAMRQVITVALFVTAYLLVRSVNRSIDKLGETEALTEHQSEIAYHLADLGIFLVAGSIALSLWGVDLTNVFISAGALSVVVGLAARATLSAMVAGFVLLFSRPFEVGDWIQVNGQSGVVIDVTLFNTKLQTFSDKHVLIPNDRVTSNELLNLTDNDQLRIDVSVGVDYDTDLERALDVVEEAAEDSDAFRTSPAPKAVLREFGDSAVVIGLHAWIDRPTKRRVEDARTEAIRAIRSAFDREGIDIPYPQRVVDSRDDSGFRIAPDDATASVPDRN
ncbi:mechanosensitive ion channel family protein [Halopelagius longus]|uniref:Mechanosensitive ion channel n=1 Tax=Halopelagius longus TaxID=1236180 RepID=A0A1H1BJZ4_9EURY|nr:mechanosensitive ion channel family protein [Halopelagius longus]RDI70797.1 mechanosensitive ion channel family protein [Halopelagius longus]SDQ51676.1 Mechanosensitive ion channel [Halopelagius longus]